MTRHIDVNHVARPGNEAGNGIAAMASCIEQDDRRWDMSDRTPRVASHSPDDPRGYCREATPAP